MNGIPIAYLGPEGTYSHIVAMEHFKKGCRLFGQSSILDIFYFVSETPNGKGVIPVENSSGGPIAESLDLLINNNFDISIEESINLKVKLALLGKKNRIVKTIYSHSIPMYHCDKWIRKNLPGVTKNLVASTAKAAELAAEDKNSAAIASVNASAIYQLDILVYPIEQDISNTTQFFVISKDKPAMEGPNIKTSISAFLNNKPGSLYDFLEHFKLNKINLSRIISRPIYGKPSEYAFFVDIDGCICDEKVMKTVNEIKANACSLKLICSYNADKTYTL